MIEDFDKFEEKSKTEKEVNKKTLNLLRGSQAESGKKDTQTPELDKSKKSFKGQYNPFQLRK